MVGFIVLERLLETVQKLGEWARFLLEVFERVFKPEFFDKVFFNDRESFAIGWFLLKLFDWG